MSYHYGYCWVGTCIAGIALARSAPVCATASGPDCVRIELASNLPSPGAWTERLQQETRAVTAGQNISCVDIEVFVETDQPDFLVIRVRFDGLARIAVLNINEVSAPQLPRTGALLAGGLLRQILLDQRAHRLEAEDKGASNPTETKNSKEPLARAAKSRPPPVKALVRSDDQLAPVSPWSAFGMVGTNLFVANDTVVGQVELGLQRRLSTSLPMRLSFNLLGHITGASDARGKVWIGGVGLRGGPEIGIWQSGRVALWLSPSAAVLALALSTDPAEGYRSTHSYRSVVMSDVRVLTEYSITRRQRLCATVGVGFTPKYLRVQIAQHTLLSYQGLYIGCSFGYGAAFL